MKGSSASGVEKHGQPHVKNETRSLTPYGKIKSIQSGLKTWTENLIS